MKILPRSGLIGNRLLPKPNFHVLAIMMDADNDPRASCDFGAERATGPSKKWKIDFWCTALDHYSLFGIVDLEQSRTYSALQFADEFGSFQSLSK